MYRDIIIIVMILMNKNIKQCENEHFVYKI